MSEAESTLQAWLQTEAQLRAGRREGAESDASVFGPRSSASPSSRSQSSGFEDSSKDRGSSSSGTGLGAGGRSDQADEERDRRDRSGGTAFAIHAEGRTLGVAHTPTFFVNGRRSPEYTDGALLSVVEHVLGNRSP